MKVSPRGLVVSGHLCETPVPAQGLSVPEPAAGSSVGTRRGPGEGEDAEGVKQAALPAISQSASGSLRSTLLIKLCTNISFSIRGILILHTDQGHSDYYTLLKINFKNALVLEMC